MKKRVIYLCVNYGSDNIFKEKVKEIRFIDNNHTLMVNKSISDLMGVESVLKNLCKRYVS